MPGRMRSTHAACCSKSWMPRLRIFLKISALCSSHMGSEGRSFKQLADETGLSVNTLLSRKHYAVLQLGRRLQAIYHEFKSK